MSLGQVFDPNMEEYATEYRLFIVLPESLAVNLPPPLDCTEKYYFPAPNSFKHVYWSAIRASQYLNRRGAFISGP